MRLPSRLFFVFVCLLICTPAWAQTGSPVVYVSSGTTIFSVTTATSPTPGVVTPLITNSGADYEGLVVGPNNDPSTSSADSYLLYACDPTHNTIIRFDPNAAHIVTDTVYQGTAAHNTLQQPQCGRLDSAGDLIVNSEAAGSGAWKIAGVASLPLGTPTASFPAPVQLLGTAISKAQAGQGVTQKYVGDLLAVDSVGNRVVRSAIVLPACSTIQLPACPTTGYSFVNPSTPFITTNLSSPFGIARNNGVGTEHKNPGQVYVSDHTKKNKGDVQLFDSTGTFVSTCVSSSTFGNQQPNFLGVAEDGTLYVAAASSSAGFVWSVTQSAAGTCTATQLATTTSLPPLTGIALPPTQTSIPLSQPGPGQGTLSYNFGSSLFNLTTGACNLTVTKTLLPTPALTALANIATGQKTIDNESVMLNGGVAAPYLGDGGFATKYSTPDVPDTCSNTAFEYFIAAFVDQGLFPNPWIITCEPAGTTNCAATDVHGIYFLGGLLPDDLGTSSTGGHHSDFFVANMNLNSPQSQATLNLESPLTQVSPPNLAGTFSSGSTISVKFKFTPTITNAVAVLAVAQVCQPGTPTNDPVCGPNGQASVFPINIININAEGSSTVPPPFVTSGNQQYSFSLSLKGYAPGIYSLSVIVLSGNSNPVTVIVKII